MKDHEILWWLMNLEPENDLQKKAIESAEREFRSVIKYDIDDGVKEFLGAYKKENIVNKASGELYAEYLEFCTDYDYTEVSQAILTKTVRREYNVNCKVIKVNGKSKRIYK